MHAMGLGLSALNAAGGGSAPLVFPTIANLVRFEADLGTANTGGNLDSWTDQNALGMVWTASSGARPTLVANADPLGTGPAVRLNGTSNVMATTKHLSDVFDWAGGNFAIFLVWKNTSTAGATGNGYQEPCTLCNDSGYFAGAYGNATQIGSSIYATGGENNLPFTQAPGSWLYTKHKLVSSASGTLTTEVVGVGSATPRTNCGAPSDGILRFGANYNVTAWAKGDYAAMYLVPTISGPDEALLDAYVLARYGL